MGNDTTTITQEDLLILTHSKSKMENVGYVMKGLNFVGGSIEGLIKKIPPKQQTWLNETINKVLMSVIKANLKTMSKSKKNNLPSKKTYKTVVTASGFGFGFFGDIGFAFDLGIFTKFVMRSIIDIARSKGEDINSIETQLACLEVFALGGSSKDDDGINTSYYATREVLSKSVKEATSYIVKNGTSKIVENVLISSNPISKLISSIASRYGVQVTEKFAAELIPVVGAIGGGGINYIFINHFQKMAEAHFTIRQLERKYGENSIREKYNEISV
jgi:preprotein translocase subunit Sss1